MTEAGRMLARYALQAPYQPAPAPAGRITEVGLGPVAAFLVPIAGSVAGGVGFGLGAYAIQEMLAPGDEQRQAQTMSWLDWFDWREELSLLDMEATEGIRYVKPNAPPGPDGWGSYDDADYMLDVPKLSGTRRIAWEVAKKKAEQLGEPPGNVAVTVFQADFALRVLRVALKEFQAQQGAALPTTPPSKPAKPTPTGVPGADAQPHLLPLVQSDRAAPTWAYWVAGLVGGAVVLWFVTRKR